VIYLLIGAGVWGLAVAFIVGVFHLAKQADRAMEEAWYDSADERDE
jgi:hypothetical protein